MGKKMYYTEQEAAERLDMDPSALESLVREHKIRAFRDGSRRMFRVDEVDALAESPQPAPTEGDEIQLSPADTSSDIVSLTEADTGKGAEPIKEDTVITTEGISIFDDEDLEVTADPLAKTQIAPSMEDHYNVEGVGSGSGLLDLTRESDDTSLGAEVLDHIDMEGTVGPIGSSIAEAVAEPEQFVGRGEVQQVQTIPDPTAGLFSGIIVACSLIALVLGAVTLSAMSNSVPDYLEWLKSNMLIVMAAAVVVVVAGAVAGYILGKPSAKSAEGA